MNKFFKCGKYNLDLSQKKHIMGILNVTPDSFSDGGRWFNPDLAIKRALEIQSQGADILDIGAQSTRPDYIKISSLEEWSRLQEVLKGLKDKIKIPISIDTFYPEVAEKALDCGVDIVNDVTGFKNKEMFKIVANRECGLIIMHDGKLSDMVKFFEKQIDKAIGFSIDLNRICLDPGIGFGKTYEENLFILGNTDNFRVKNRAMLVGASKKRVIGRACGDLPIEQRTPGTIVAHSVAMLSGADIIRAHDVLETVQSARIIEEIIRIKAEKGQ